MPFVVARHGPFSPSHHPGSCFRVDQDRSIKSAPNIVVVFTDDRVGRPLPTWSRTSRLHRRPPPRVVSPTSARPAGVLRLPGIAAHRLLHESRWGSAGAPVPSTRHGLDPDEHTIAEAVKPLGYATACYGKWHLGHLGRSSPTRIDEYYGIPYRTTCGPPSRVAEGVAATADLRRRRGVRVRADRLHRRSRRAGAWSPGADRRAVDFIDRHADRPFLLYVPHSMPHVPLGAGPAFRRARCTAPTVT